MAKIRSFNSNSYPLHAFDLLDAFYIHPLPKNKKIKMKEFSFHNNNERIISIS